MKKLRIIDLTRSLAILAVMAMHGSSFTRPLENSIAQFLFFRFQRNGSYGVFAFFVVSGFLISKIIDEGRGGLFNPDFKEFYVRRAGRILPLLLLVVSLGALLMGVLPPSPKVNYIFGTSIDKFDLWFWLSIVFFCINWLQFFGHPRFYHGAHWAVLWTLSIEEQFYFFFPLALRKLKNTRNLVVFLIVVIFTALVWRVIAYNYFPWGLNGGGANSLGLFDLIAIGILLYLVFKRYQKYFSAHPGVSLAICLLGLFLTVGIYLFTYINNLFEQIYVWPLFGASLALFLLGGMGMTFFEAKFFWLLSLPGKYCYGMYLYHNLVLLLVGSFLPRMNGLLAYLLFVVMTGLIASVSYHFFELPANRLIRKVFFKKGEWVKYPSSSS